MFEMRVNLGNYMLHLNSVEEEEEEGGDSFMLRGIKSKHQRKIKKKKWEKENPGCVALEGLLHREGSSG